MNKLENILQLGSFISQEHAARSKGPVYLSGKTDLERLGSLSKKPNGLAHPQEEQKVSEYGMDTFLKKISGLASKEANRKLN